MNMLKVTAIVNSWPSLWGFITKYVFLSDQLGIVGEVK